MGPKKYWSQKRTPDTDLQKGPAVLEVPAAGAEGIRTVQDLLGHASLKTTMVYTHVAAKNKMGVKSPLDTLD